MKTIYSKKFTAHVCETAGTLKSNRLWICLGLMLAIHFPFESPGQEKSDIRSKALERLKVARCHLQDISIPAADIVAKARLQSRALNIPIVIDGEKAELRLQPHSLRSKKFKLLIDRGAGGLREVPVPPETTWRGFVIGKPGSQVCATITKGGLKASIRSANGSWWAIQPARELAPNAGLTEHVIYDSRDLLPTEGTCGVVGGRAMPKAATQDQAGTGTAELQSPPLPGPVKITEIAFDADYEYFQLNGGSAEATMADIESVLNAVDEIYVRDVGIAYELSTVVVRETESDPYSTSAADDLLADFRDEWNINHISISRQVTHLMTGRDLEGNVVGKAYIDTICNSPAFAYGLSQSRFSESFPRRIALTAHELGHNWDACHCNDSDCVQQPQSDCDIMLSSVPSVPSNTFGTASKNQIISHKNANGWCLTDGDVYVDADAIWPYLGTSLFPYKTVTDGLNGVPTRGRVLIRGTKSYNESVTVTRSGSMHAIGGRVTIGR